MDWKIEEGTLMEGEEGAHRRRLVEYQWYAEKVVEGSSS